MVENEEIKKALAYLGLDLVEDLLANGKRINVKANTAILEEGAYVKSVPVVLSGLIKVYTEYKEKELLLYYIRPYQLCVMSFAGALANEPSKIQAVCEEDTELLLLPIEKIPLWLKNYPSLNAMFFNQYNLRYADLLDTIQHLLFDKMDTRVMKFLQQRVSLTGKNPIKISHRQIAGEIGTAREVVSRIVKKLEHEGKLIQHSDNIEILEKN